jgi:hypothetical protein
MRVGEIGGDFCLADLLCPVEYKSAYSRLVARWEQQAYLSMYSSGRAAYYAILKHMAAEADCSLRVLLPSYLCHTMLEPVWAAGLETVFYEIRGDLSIDMDDLVRLMRTGPSVIVIRDYFGFRGSLQVLDNPHLPMADDHLVLYDATHSALDQERWRPVLGIMELLARSSGPVHGWHMHVLSLQRPRRIIAERAALEHRVPNTVRTLVHMRTCLKAA